MMGEMTGQAWYVIALMVLVIVLVMVALLLPDEDDAQAGTPLDERKHVGRP